MQTITIPTADATHLDAAHDQRKLDARLILQEAMDAYGLSDITLRSLANRPTVINAVRQLADIMATALRDQERVRAICTPDPMQGINAHRTLR